MEGLGSDLGRGEWRVCQGDPGRACAGPSPRRLTTDAGPSGGCAQSKPFPVDGLGRRPSGGLMLSAIVAVAQNGVIGRADGRRGLPWSLPSELAYFRRMTLGQVLVMGRKTWDSLPRKPLEDRWHIILSRRPAGVAHAPCSRVVCLPDQGAVLDRVKQLGRGAMVIGGAQIYELFLPFCQKIYLTRVHKRARGDVFFPEIDPSEWMLSEESDPVSCPGDETSYTLCVFSRRQRDFGGL